MFRVSGHGDKTSCAVPKLVKDIGEVGQVACGSVHTVAVSQDGKLVWSFGSGDNGKSTGMRHETFFLCRFGFLEGPSLCGNFFFRRIVKM